MRVTPDKGKRCLACAGPCLTRDEWLDMRRLGRGAAVGLRARLESQGVAKETLNKAPTPRTRRFAQVSRMSAPPPFLSSAASNTGCAAPGRAASHTPPSLPTPALSPLREVPKIPVPLACSLRLRKHRTKHPAEPAMRQGWVWWIAYAITASLLDGVRRGRRRRVGNVGDEYW